MVGEDGVPPTRASLRLKDLDKFWVPMQLEMEKDLECDKEWAVCCGYDAMLLRGSELDYAPRSEWTQVRVGECSSCPRNYPGRMTLASWP